MCILLLLFFEERTGQQTSTMVTGDCRGVGERREDKERGVKWEGRERRRGGGREGEREGRSRAAVVGGGCVELFRRRKRGLLSGLVWSVLSLRLRRGEFGGGGQVEKETEARKEYASENR